MAPRNSTVDAIDDDPHLIGMTPTFPKHADGDVIPFPPPRPDIQDDSETSSSESSNSPSARPSLPRARAKKARKAAHETQPSKPLLRPAKDILSRIRHDPAMDESDYIVGYHDRHADVMEMDVSSWKGGGDVTDGEWIPQHRILYFRKKDDEEGRRIWDRASRLDRVFGSGVVAEELEHDDVESSHEQPVSEDTQEDESTVVGHEVGQKESTVGSHDGR